MIKVDIKIFKILGVILVPFGDVIFGRESGLLRPDHDRSSVGVISTNKSTFMAVHFLKARVDIGFDVF